MDGWMSDLVLDIYAGFSRNQHFNDFHVSLESRLMEWSIPTLLITSQGVMIERERE